MHTHSDWLLAHGMTPPQGHVHLQCLKAEYPDIFHTFTSVGMEQEVRFENVVHSPDLFGQFVSDSQLLGPNVMFHFNTTSRHILATSLAGSGTAERTLAHLINNTFLLLQDADNAEPEVMNLYMPGDENRTMPALMLLEPMLTIEVRKKRCQII